MSFRKERQSTVHATRTADMRGRYGTGRVKYFDDRARLTVAETREKEALFYGTGRTEQAEIDWHRGCKS